MWSFLPSPLLIGSNTSNLYLKQFKSISQASKLWEFYELEFLRELWNFYAVTFLWLFLQASVFLSVIVDHRELLTYTLFSSVQQVSNIKCMFLENYALNLNIFKQTHFQGSNLSLFRSFKLTKILKIKLFFAIYKVFFIKLFVVLF